MSERQRTRESAFGDAFKSVLAAPPEPTDPEELRLVCDELDGLPPQQVRLLALNSRRVRRPQVVWELIRRSEALRFRGPERMLHVAGIAQAVAQRLPTDSAPNGCVADVQVEGLVAQANALKVMGDLRAADLCLAKAADLSKHGSGDPLPNARLQWVLGSVRQRQGRFAEAKTALQEAASLYSRVGESGLAGAVLISVSIVAKHLGDFAGGIRAAVEGGRLLAATAEPELRLFAMQNVAANLVEVNEPGFAAALLEEIQDLYEALPRHLPLLRLRWLQGRIQASLKKPVEARVALNAVRRTFLEMGLFFDAALVSLELAVLYADAGWPHEVERLAEEMYPVFLSRDLPREASGALLLFVQAVNERTATPERIRHILAELQAQQRPSEA